MESIDKQINKRASREQLEFFIDFARRNPELLANKNDPTNPQRVRNMWNDLSESLNAMGGPIRPTMKWKETLTHWKHSLRSRARKLKCQNLMTGGGPQTEKKLKKFEERALECFGTIAVDGLPGLPTLGLPDTNKTTPNALQYESDYDVDNVEEFLLPLSSQTATAPLEKIIASECESECDEEYLEEFLLPSNSKLTTAPSETKKPVSTPVSQPSKTIKNDSTHKLVQSIIKKMDEKEKKDEEIYREFLKVQNSLAEAIKALGESVRYLADSISRHNSLSKPNDANDSFSSNSS